MNPLLLVLRVVHLLTGVVWVGFAIFLHYVLAPALQELGPDAGRFMGAVQRSRLVLLLPLIGLLTILSGTWLLWLVSGGQLSAFLGTGPGISLGLAACCAVVAFLLGVLVTRPAMFQAGQLMQQVAAAPNPAERDRLLQLASRLRRRGGMAGGAGALLLLAAATGMAVARYL